MATRRKAAKDGARAGAKPRAAAAPRTRPSTPREFRDQVVLEKTGRTREEWFAVLDAFDARTRGHKASAAHLMDDMGVPPWWSQAITVEYERVRGIRSYGERTDGFACGVQRALAVPVGRAWQAFADPVEVSQWTSSEHRHRFREGSRWTDTLGGRGAFERIVDGRMVRFTWAHPTRAPHSVVEVEFRARGDDRCTVKLTHRKIRSAEEREDMRSHWSWALDSLKSFVERGAAIPHHEWLATR